MAGSGERSLGGGGRFEEAWVVGGTVAQVDDMDGCGTAGKACVVGDGGGVEQAAVGGVHGREESSGGGGVHCNDT